MDREYKISSERRMRKLLKHLRSEEFIRLNRGPNNIELQDKITEFCREFSCIKDQVFQGHKSTYERVERILEIITNKRRN